MEAVHASPVDESQQVPSLLSMIVEGFPQVEQSKHTPEAYKLLAQYIARWPNITSFDAYCRSGLLGTSYMLPRALDAHRLLTAGIHWGCNFLIDDMFYDTQHTQRLFLADEFGIDRSVYESPSRIQECCDHIMAVFAQEKPIPRQAPAIEVIMGELGHHMLELSNPEWFGAFVAKYRLYLRSCVDTQADFASGQHECVQNLDLYSAMRVANVGGEFIQLLVEFVQNSFLPSEVRELPFMQKLTHTTSVHLGFANDVYSFHKEYTQEESVNPRNLVILLMETEGLPVAQAIRAAIEVTNKHGRSVVELEAEAWTPVLQQHVIDMKALMAGNVYFGMIDERYRQPDSVFPEQRDITSFGLETPPTMPVVVEA